jgi:hypothetical protein
MRSYYCLSVYPPFTSCYEAYEITLLSVCIFSHLSLNVPKVYQTLQLSHPTFCMHL